MLLFTFSDLKKKTFLNFPVNTRTIQVVSVIFLIIAGLEQLGYEHHISTQGPYLSSPPPRPVDSDPKSKGALKINIKIFFALFV